VDPSNLKFGFISNLNFEKINQAADRAKARVMHRSGGLVRKIMKQSIRKRKKISAPGRPPHAHVGSSRFGLRKIFYKYDPRDQTVVVGPLGGREAGLLTKAPKTLEFGGMGIMQLNARDRKRLGRKTVVTRVRKRPFARPALETFAKDYPDMWKDSIR
jgi:hypothetical protein